MSLTSGAGIAIVAPDGTVHPRIEVQWTTPLDVLTTQIQIEYQLAPGGVASGPWIPSGFANAALNLAYISNVVAGQQYNVRIRSVRPSGAFSTWAEIDDYTVSLTLSVLSSAAAAGTLSAVAYSDGTAAIFGRPFRFSIGSATAFVSPSNYPLINLGQAQIYWVYYIEPTFAGGAVIANVTENPAGFQGKVGYYLIGQIETPVYGGSVIANGSWYPTIYADMQDGATQPTLYPEVPIDRDPTVFASLTGSYWSLGSGGPYSEVDCEIIYSGWPVFTPLHGPVLHGGTAPTLTSAPARALRPLRVMAARGQSRYRSTSALRGRYSQPL